jgi:hypothetical protein
MLKLKKYLIYTRRYLGMAFCVLFAIWLIWRRTIRFAGGSVSALCTRSLSMWFLNE